MDKIQDSLFSGGVALVIGVFITVVAAEVVEPPWELTQILIAVAMASAFAGFFGDYFAAREYEVRK